MRLAACLTLFSVVGLAACAPSKAFVASDYVRPQRLAILPMANDTNDLDGPILVRQMLFTALSQRGYALVPLKEVDEKLKLQGFTDGGQLKAATPLKIGEWVGADGLLYSTLEEFNYITLGYYTQRSVKIVARVVNVANGEKFWEAERGWATRAVATDKKQAEQQLTVQLAVKFAEKLTHTPLRLESLQAVTQLLNTLP